MRANGEGSITVRKDGTYHGRVYVTTTSGIRKPVSVYGKTRDDVREKITEIQAQDNKGIPMPDTNAKVQGGGVPDLLAGERGQGQPAAEDLPGVRERG